MTDKTMPKRIETNSRDRSESNASSISAKLKGMFSRRSSDASSIRSIKQGLFSRRSSNASSIKSMPQASPTDHFEPARDDSTNDTQTLARITKDGGFRSFSMRDLRKASIDDGGTAKTKVPGAVKEGRTSKTKFDKVFKIQHVLGIKKKHIDIGLLKYNESFSIGSNLYSPTDIEATTGKNSAFQTPYLLGSNQTGSGKRPVKIGVANEDISSTSPSSEDDVANIMDWRTVRMEQTDLVRSEDNPKPHSSKRKRKVHVPIYRKVSYLSKFVNTRHPVQIRFAKIWRKIDEVKKSEENQQPLRKFLNQAQEHGFINALRNRKPVVQYNIRPLVHNEERQIRDARNRFTVHLLPSVVAAATKRGRRVRPYEHLAIWLLPFIVHHLKATRTLNLKPPSVHLCDPNLEYIDRTHESMTLFRENERAKQEKLDAARKQGVMEDSWDDPPPLPKNSSKCNTGAYALASPLARTHAQDRDDPYARGANNVTFNVGAPLQVLEQYVRPENPVEKDQLVNNLIMYDEVGIFHSDNYDQPSDLKLSSKLPQKVPMETTTSSRNSDAESTETLASKKDFSGGNSNSTNPFMRAKKDKPLNPFRKVSSPDPVTADIPVTKVHQKRPESRPTSSISTAETVITRASNNPYNAIIGNTELGSSERISRVPDLCKKISDGGSLNSNGTSDVSIPTPLSSGYKPSNLATFPQRQPVSARPEQSFQSTKSFSIEDQRNAVRPHSGFTADNNGPIVTVGFHVPEDSQELPARVERNKFGDYISPANTAFLGWQLEHSTARTITEEAAGSVILSRNVFGVQLESRTGFQGMLNPPAMRTDEQISFAQGRTIFDELRTDPDAKKDCPQTDLLSRPGVKTLEKKAQMLSGHVPGAVDDKRSKINQDVPPQPESKHKTPNNDDEELVNVKMTRAQYLAMMQKMQDEHVLQLARDAAGKDSPASNASRSMECPGDSMFGPGSSNSFGIYRDENRTPSSVPKSYQRLNITDTYRGPLYEHIFPRDEQYRVESLQKNLRQAVSVGLHRDATPDRPQNFLPLLRTGEEAYPDEHETRDTGKEGKARQRRATTESSTSSDKPLIMATNSYLAREAQREAAEASRSTTSFKSLRPRSPSILNPTLLEKNKAERIRERLGYSEKMKSISFDHSPGRNEKKLGQYGVNAAAALEGDEFTGTWNDVPEANET
ncbi:hypothetical protein EDC01DRAFT_636277 [Geopyxis carbonaria]|nr:hypothetical protein EDC01DRAFT_636277 [Geopyxis carbonaria]